VLAAARDLPDGQRLQALDELRETKLDLRSERLLDSK
jgi:hypothetical protein